MRWIWRVILGAALVVPAIAVAAYAWLVTGLPDYTVTVESPDLAAPVQVMHDAHGVPHIFAPTVDDAYFALGFVHARDRLWQMDVQRRLGAGRLAELVGERAVPLDRFMRVLGTYGLAERTYDDLPAQVRRAVDAYADGVNAWMATRDRPHSPEFYVIGYDPEPWQPADTLVLSRLFAFQLSGNYRDELLRLRLAGQVGEDRVGDLFPDGPSPLVSIDQARATDLADRLWAALPDGLGATGASNVWIMSGDRTPTGLPILANDPHLGLTAPSPWYLARIETPELQLAGATLPGAPFHIFGHNGAIAWGLTTTGADVQDLFIERLDPDAEDRYLTPDGSVPFETREERIEVSGGDPVELTVRRTRHGPVLSDLDRDDIQEVVEDGTALALAFPGLNEGDIVAEALYRLNRAGNVDEAEAALGLWFSPLQNIAIADRDGGIALITPGLVPVRRSGDGLLPVPGWTDAFAWDGFIPYEEMPRTVDPPENRIVNANNPVVGGDYPHLIAAHHYEPSYRAQRITDVLDGQRSHSPDQAAALMMDNVSLAARDLLPLMLTVTPPDTDAADILALLRPWTGEMDRERPEPLIFAMWLRQLNRELYADELGELFVDYWHLRPRTVRHMLTESQDWCDNVETEAQETCDDVLSASLSAAIQRLVDDHGGDPAAWRWGDAHRAPFSHQVVSRIPVVADILDISVETDGGDFTVNRGGTSVISASAPFSHIHGATFRGIYDLADLSQSRFMIPAGQSGNPLSPHFGGLNEAWRDGQFLHLDQLPAELSETGLGTLTLRPTAR